MEQKSLVDALADCADSCGWCVDHCLDEEKYDMLVVCISIQKEFTKVGCLTFKILAGRSFELMKKIISLCEVLFEAQLNTHLEINQNNFRTDYNLENKWRLPGCSQIFSVASSLEWMYISEDPRNNAD